MSPSNQTYKDKAFQYLESLGYIRIADNVKNSGNAYEDWYVNPVLIPSYRVKTLEPNVNFNEHFTS